MRAPESPEPRHDCRTCPVRTRHFDGLGDDDAVGQFSGLVQRLVYRDGQTLCVEGHEADRVFFLRAGSVRMSRVHPDGAEMLLDVVGAGGAVGLSALFGDRHTVTATAVGSVQCCAANAATLRGLLPSQPGIVRTLLRMLGETADRMCDRVAELAGLSADQRVAGFLLKVLPLWQVQGHKFTQADMARALSLTPETLCRILGEFRQRDWIGGQGRTLRVFQPTALAGVASGAQRVHWT